MTYSAVIRESYSRNDFVATVILKHGDHRDYISQHRSESVEACLARRFEHCGGRLPAGWTYEVIPFKS